MIRPHLARVVRSILLSGLSPYTKLQHQRPTVTAAARLDDARWHALATAIEGDDAFETSQAALAYCLTLGIQAYVAQRQAEDADMRPQ